MINRQTGRTSRMILNAVEYAKMGHQVYILCTVESRDHTRKLAIDILERLNISPEVIGVQIKFETLGSIGGINQLDLKNKTLINAHPNCRLLIDHFFYEKEFKHILDGFHQYDEF